MTGRNLGDHWTALVALRNGHRPATENERMERALAAAGAVAWEWDVSTGESNLSAGHESLLGLKDDPTEGSLALVHPDDRAWLQKVMSEAAIGEQPYDFQFRLLRPDGKVEWVHDRGHLECDALGRPSRLAGVALLITEQKRLEAAFCATFEQAALGMAHVRPDGRFLKVNDCLCRILGRSREALLVLGFQDITYPQDLEADLAHVTGLLNGPIKTYTMEKRYLRADGGMVWANLTVSLVRDANDAPDYFISVVEDISERKSPASTVPQSQDGHIRKAAARLPGDIAAEVPLRRETERQTLLLEISQAILENGRDEAALAALVFGKVSAHLNADVCFNYALNADGQALRLVAGFGIPPELADAAGILRLGQAFCGTVAATSRSLAADAARIVTDEQGAFVRGMGVHAYACHPLQGNDGQLLGTLAFASTQCDGFGEDEVDFLRTLCKFVGLAWQRRRDVAALAEGEAYLRSVLEASTDCVKVIDQDGLVAFINATGRCQLQINDSAAAQGQPWETLWPEEERHWVQQALDAARSGREFRFEAFRPSAKGKPQWWDVVVSPIYDAERRVRHIVSVSRDITSRREGEAQLARSKERFRAAVQAVSGIMWTNNARGEMEDEQPGWAGLTGQSFEQYQGYGWSKAVHPEDVQSTIDAWNGAVAARRIFVFEHRLRCHDGAWRRFAIRATPVLDKDGTLQEWVGVHTDVTEQRKAEEVLARDREKLEQLVVERTRNLQETQQRLAQSQRMEALGQLAGGIAHDFNNVLQAVRGGVALIEKRAVRADVRRLARMVAEAVERGSSVTRRLLAFSRNGELRVEAMDAAALLDNMQDILGHTLGGSIEVRVDAEPDLSMLIDRGQLETVLVNLATNARDAMPGGGMLSFSACAEVVGGRAEAGHLIRSAALNPGRYVRLAVTDTGKGMAPEVLVRASEPFFTTKGPGEGTGLGLAMAKGFTEQSGGALHIESTLDRGTTITLWFPLVPLSHAAVPAPAMEEDIAAKWVSARILLVDDDRTVREVLAEQMKVEGYDVLVAGSGTEALALLDADEAVDLLVSDLTMPGMDGIAIIREAQRRRPKLPAILLTGFVSNVAELAVGDMLKGTFSLLRKPITVEQLAERVTVLLEGIAAAG